MKASEATRQNKGEHMKNTLNKIKAAGLLVAVGLMVYPSSSFAWDRNDQNDYRHHSDRHHDDWKHDGYRDHARFGFSVNIIPNDCFRIFFGGSRFYYHDGTYYSRRHRDYVIVAPPVGVVVREIPRYYQPVMIDGSSYYTSDGIYYVYTRHGYRVVPAPTVIHHSDQYVEDDRSRDGVDCFTVNIPNYKGEYLPVVIKRSGSGFVGPQGEYYSEFPKVEQLKAMYVK